MDFGGPSFVLTIIGLSIIGWLVNNWIRARHGYALEDEWGGKTERRDTVETQSLRQENRELRDLLTKVEKRMQVLETIVTDKGYAVANEIEALRDTHSVEDNGSGVPLEIERRERA